MTQKVIILAIIGTVLSGLTLIIAPSSLLALHFIGGLLIILMISPFLYQHWWQRPNRVSHHPNTTLGYLELMGLILLTLSGILLLRWTNLDMLRWIHKSITLWFSMVLLNHIFWRHRYMLKRKFPAIIADLTLQLMFMSLIGLIVYLPQYSSADLKSSDEYYVTITHAALGHDTLSSAQTCQTCHQDLFQQWRISAHAQATTDRYYQALTSLFIEERGIEAVRYCATCHAPIGLMQGEITANAAKSNQTNTDNQAYQARGLGAEVALSNSAAEGVTCVMCHQAVKVAEPPTNGSLQLVINNTPLPTTLFDRLVLQAVPTAHQQTMRHEATKTESKSKDLDSRWVIQQAELCGSCHNLHSPEGKPLEPTYNEWLNSPYPKQGQSCQNCHFPQTMARRVDSDLSQPIAAHGGTPGAPSSLAGLADSVALLQTAATLQLELVTPQTLVVTVTNSGAGHYLPTGADDLRQVWLEVTSYDLQNNVIWQSGGLDNYGNFALNTIQFHKVLGDAQGQPIELHRFWVATQILTDTRLAPLENRLITYKISPQSVGAKVVARLLYRDVSPAFAEFALEQAKPELPIREMARAEMILGY